MDKFLKSQRKINAKYLRIMAISAYLNSEVMKNLVGDDLYDFYTIGDIYKEEFRKE